MGNAIMIGGDSEFIIKANSDIQNFANLNFTNTTKVVLDMDNRTGQFTSFLDIGSSVSPLTIEVRNSQNYKLPNDNIFSWCDKISEINFVDGIKIPDNCRYFFRRFNAPTAGSVSTMRIVNLNIEGCTLFGDSWAWTYPPIVDIVFCGTLRNNIRFAMTLATVNKITSATIDSLISTLADLTGTEESYTITSYRSHFTQAQQDAVTAKGWTLSLS